MKVSIDDDGCRGHGVCTTICPEVFTLNDDGYAEVLSPAVPAEFEAAIRRAAASCPERAITVAGIDDGPGRAPAERSTAR